ADTGVERSGDDGVVAALQALVANPCVWITPAVIVPGHLALGRAVHDQVGIDLIAAHVDHVGRSRFPLHLVLSRWLAYPRRGVRTGQGFIVLEDGGRLDLLALKHRPEWPILFLANGHGRPRPAPHGYGRLPRPATPHECARLSHVG